jgi:hypothetical protein
MNAKKFFLSAGGFFGFLAEGQAGTCALCREVLRSGGNVNLIKGYYWSIILIVLVPLILLGIGIRYALRRY